MKLTFREVDESNWPDFARFFESKGCPAYCWCLAWRPLANRAHATNAERKVAMQRIVKAGTPVGLLGYDGEQPVAWCSIAPRASYRPLGGAEYPGVAEDAVWSLVCFFVPKPRRGQGLMPQLLQAAIKTARKHGARVVEAYPVDADSPSYRFMGFMAAFKKAGFTEMGRAGTRRHVMHLKVQ